MFCFSFGMHILYVKNVSCRKGVTIAMKNNFVNSVSKVQFIYDCLMLVNDTIGMLMIIYRKLHIIPEMWFSRSIEKINWTDISKPNCEHIINIFDKELRNIVRGINTCFSKYREKISAIMGFWDR